MKLYMMLSLTLLSFIPLCAVRCIQTFKNGQGTILGVAHIQTEEKKYHTKVKYLIRNQKLHNIGTIIQIIKNDGKAMTFGQAGQGYSVTFNAIKSFVEQE